MIDNIQIPKFSGSLDAKVPSENVVLAHYMPDFARWVVASEASDGAILIGTGNTEALARRAAGLRTLAHLESRAEGKGVGQTQSDIDAAREELARELSELARVVETTNVKMPEFANKKLMLLELQTTADALEAGAKRDILARIAAPILTFIALAFAEGIIGAYAQKCLDALGKVLAYH